MAKKKTLAKKEEEIKQPIYIPPPMTENPKFKAIEALKAEGYEVYNEDGVVMVSFEFNGNKNELPKIMKEVERIITSVGYRGSFGCRARRSEKQ